MCGSRGWWAPRGGFCPVSPWHPDSGWGLNCLKSSSLTCLLSELKNTQRAGGSELRRHVSRETEPGRHHTGFFYPSRRAWKAFNHVQDTWYTIRVHPLALRLLSTKTGESSVNSPLVFRDIPKDAVSLCRPPVICQCYKPRPEVILKLILFYKWP